MPTVGELERLEALVTRLRPIGEVQRGELIRAEDWNTVVRALIEGLRAVLSDATQAGAVSAHEHVDQVSIGWLDPRVRTLLEKGPLGEPTATTKLDGFERRIALSTERLTQLDESIRETRNITSDIAVREEKRDTDLLDLRRSVDAIPDAREDVLTLRETLRGVQTDVRRAIEIGDGLRVNGQPFNATAFDQRLGGVEALRERLTSPDGTIFDANALERRLTALTNTFVTRPQLDDVLTRPVNLSADQMLILEENLTNRVGQRFTDDLNRSSTDLRAEMAQRFATVDGLVGQRITDATPGVTTSVLGTVRTEIDNRAAANRTELLNVLEQRLATSAAGVLSTLDQRLSGFETRVTANLTELMTTRIGDALTPLRADITRLDAGTRQNSDAITRIDRTQADQGARIETIARNDEQARRGLQTSLIEEMDRRQQLQNTSLDQRFTQLESRIQDRLNTAITDATRSLVPQLEQMAAAAARREAQIVVNQVRGEIRDIAREEVTVVVEGVRTSFRDEVNRSDQRIAGLITSEVRRQTSNLPDLVRNEINVTRPSGPGGPLIRGGGG